MRKITRVILIMILTAALAIPAQGFAVQPVSAAKVKAPSPTTVTSITHGKTTVLSLTWKKVSKVTGYEIQYANNRFFLNPVTLRIKGDSKTSTKITGVSTAELYYARIRTYKTSDNKNKYSTWALSSNCKMNKNASVLAATLNNKDKDVFELREAAKQKVGKYDTLQGGCAYGNTGWFILNNRNKNNCKIVKVNLKKMKVVKASDVLPVAHGSDLAYNPNTKQLVVAHGPSKYKNISIVDPTTLTLIKTQELTLPYGTPGASKNHCKTFKGVTALTYNTKHKVYVGRLKAQGHIVMYDNNFKAVKYVTLKKKDNQMFQGMDSVDDFILIGQSFLRGRPYNIITVYDWEGNYLSKINVTKKNELETVFHTKDALYVGMYKSYYKTYYIDGFKIKVTKGKKNKVKTKLKYTKLMRDNYFYKVANL